MIFDIGCCCSAPITGLYDFYAVASWGNTVNPVINDAFAFEIDSVLSRHPSHRVIIGDSVIGTTNRISDIFTNRRISCVTNDWYVNLASGSGMNDVINSDFFQKQYAISPNHNTDLVWLRHSDISDVNSSYNALYDGSTGLGTGWTVGSGARLENNSIVLTLTGTTSGAYIEKTLPGQDIPWYLRFQLHNDYDKYILLTTETSGATVEPYSGYNVWITNSIPQRNSLVNTTTVNTGASSLFFPNIDAYKVGDYIEYQISFAHSQGTMYLEFDPITKLRITMVDSLSGFTIDDVSGYNAEIREIYFSYGKNEESYYNYNAPLGRCQISLINPENKTILTRFNPISGQNFGDIISGTNLQSLLKMTGQNRMSQEEFFGLFPNFSTDGYISDNNYHTTSNMSYMSDELEEFISYEFLNSGDYDWNGVWRYGNVVIPYREGNCACYNTSISNNATGISFRAFTKDAGKYFHSISDNIFLNSWSNLATNYAFINNWYDSMFIINNTGGTGFIFGENFRIENAEYYIPTGVKFIIATGGDKLLEPYENDFNTGPNFPRIQLFTPRDFPNCFSVLQPKALSVFRTGQGIPESLEQTISILYGPYKQDTHTVSYFSGHGESLGSLLNVTGLTKHEVVYGPTNNLTGAFFDIEHHYIYGDSGNSQVFWSDSFTQQRMPYPVYTNGPTGIYKLGMSAATAFGEDGKYRPNLTAKVLFGDVYNGIPGAIFTHSYNYTGAGTTVETEYWSGEAYIKVKIGDNIVYNQRLWAMGYGLAQSAMVMARGLTALQNTESSQTSNMSGHSAAFVWFEKLWSTPPAINHTGIETGWRMHVTNSTGLDLWTLDATGYHANWDVDSPAGFDYDKRRRPRVVSSSDRYFYVNDFFVPCRGGVPENFDFNLIYPTGFTGFVPSSGTFFYITMTGHYINASPHVAFSHDGRCRFPLGRTYDSNNTVIGIKDSGYVISLPIGDVPFLNNSSFLGFNTAIFDVYQTDSIKNSDRLPYCPPYNMYENPTGSPLYIGPFDYLPSGTGMGLPLYTTISGEIIIASGIRNSGFYD